MGLNLTIILMLLGVSFNAWCTHNVRDFYDKAFKLLGDHKTKKVTKSYDYLVSYAINCQD